MGGTFRDLRLWCRGWCKFHAAPKQSAVRAVLHEKAVCRSKNGPSLDVCIADSMCCSCFQHCFIFNIYAFGGWETLVYVFLFRTQVVGSLFGVVDGSRRTHNMPLMGHSVHDKPPNDEASLTTDCALNKLVRGSVVTQDYRSAHDGSINSTQYKKKKIQPCLSGVRPRRNSGLMIIEARVLWQPRASAWRPRCNSLGFLCSSISRWLLWISGGDQRSSYMPCASRLLPTAYLRSADADFVACLKTMHPACSRGDSGGSQHSHREGYSSESPGPHAWGFALNYSKRRGE